MWAQGEAGQWRGLESRRGSNQGEAIGAKDPARRFGEIKFQQRCIIYQHSTGGQRTEAYCASFSMRLCRRSRASRERQMTSTVFSPPIVPTTSGHPAESIASATGCAPL